MSSVKKLPIGTPERTKKVSGNSKKRRWYEGHDVDGLTDDFEGIGHSTIAEVKRRRPFFLSDFVDGLTFKSFSSALAMFFATYFATMSLATHIQQATNNRIGISEYLIINSIAGVLHSIFGAQPLLILRPSESTTLMLIFLSKTADMFQYDFYQLLAATGYFLGVNLILISITEASRFLRYVTRFTYELFIVFICSLYIYDGIGDILSDFNDTGSTSEEQTIALGKSLFMACLAIMTFAIAMCLHYSVYWVILTKDIRTILSDYALAIAVIASTFFSYAFSVASKVVERVDMPMSIGPTCIHTHAYEDLYPTQQCYSTESGLGSYSRSWFVNFNSLTTINVWILAFFCALPISFLFFMDQNVAALLSQQNQNKLRKGAYYHYSFLILGLLNFLAPSFGLPFISASSPHSQQFVRYLTTFNSDFTVRYVNENRLTPLLVYLLIGLTVFFPKPLSLIPLGTIRGVLTFIGFVGLMNCQLWDRVLCLFKPPEDFVEQYNKKGIAGFRVHLYTILQVGIFCVCWVINLSPGEFGGGLDGSSMHSNATDASALPLIDSSHNMDDDSGSGVFPMSRAGVFPVPSTSVRNAVTEPSRPYPSQFSTITTAAVNAIDKKCPRPGPGPLLTTSSTFTHHSQKPETMTVSASVEPVDTNTTQQTKVSTDSLSVPIMSAIESVTATATVGDNSLHTGSIPTNAMDHANEPSLSIGTISGDQIQSQSTPSSSLPLSMPSNDVSMSSGIETVPSTTMPASVVSETVVDPIAMPSEVTVTTSTTTNPATSISPVATTVTAPPVVPIDILVESVTSNPIPSQISTSTSTIPATSAAVPTTSHSTSPGGLTGPIASVMRSPLQPSPLQPRPMTMPPTSSSGIISARLLPVPPPGTGGPGPGPSTAFTPKAFAPRQPPIMSSSFTPLSLPLQHSNSNNSNSTTTTTTTPAVTPPSPVSSVSTPIASDSESTQLPPSVATTTTTPSPSPSPVVTAAAMPSPHSMNEVSSTPSPSTLPANIPLQVRPRGPVLGPRPGSIPPVYVPPSGMSPIPRPGSIAPYDATKLGIPPAGFVSPTGLARPPEGQGLMLQSGPRMTVPRGTILTRPPSLTAPPGMTTAGFQRPPISGTTTAGAAYVPAPLPRGGGVPLSVTPTGLRVPPPVLPSLQSSGGGTGVGAVRIPPPMSLSSLPSPPIVPPSIIATTVQTATTTTVVPEPNIVPVSTPVVPPATAVTQTTTPTTMTSGVGESTSTSSSTTNGVDK
eukprot:gene2208-4295_t